MFTGFFDYQSRKATWLHPGGPLQWDWELSAMLHIFQMRQPKTIVEIGSFEGYTLERMASLAPPGARLLSIDPVARIERSSRGGLNRPEVEVMLLTARSDEPTAIRHAEQMAGLEWLLIDGDHSYEGVLFDFQTYGPMVLPGGIIALHDIYPSKAEDEIQVHRLWNEIVRAGYVTQELVCPRTPDLWGGIGLVYVGA